MGPRFFLVLHASCSLILIVSSATVGCWVVWCGHWWCFSNWFPSCSWYHEHPGCVSSAVGSATIWHVRNSWATRCFTPYDGQSKSTSTNIVELQHRPVYNYELFVSNNIELYHGCFVRFAGEHTAGRGVGFWAFFRGVFWAFVRGVFWVWFWAGRWFGFWRGDSSSSQSFFGFRWGSRVGGEHGWVQCYSASQSASSAASSCIAAVAPADAGAVAAAAVPAAVVATTTTRPAPNANQ